VPVRIGYIGGIEVSYGTESCACVHKAVLIACVEIALVVHEVLLITCVEITLVVHEALLITRIKITAVGHEIFLVSHKACRLPSWLLGARRNSCSGIYSANPAYRRNR